jgi:DNA polymerase IV (archaeal DinB-like DNA polymerase)
LTAREPSPESFKFSATADQADNEARVVMHIDIDSFYPSVEINQNPTLRGKPVIVGADPKGGRGRGVVVSCSYEARKFGIHAGQPISRAFKLGPNAVYIRPNFQLYSAVSKRVMNILRGFGDNFEQVSIDEAFLEVTRKVSGDYEKARKLAMEIKTEVESREGLTCSIGIAPNKSGAKIASDFQKPDGLVVVPSGELRSFLAPLPAKAITGIGSKTEEFLNSIGVRTIGDLQKISGNQLVKYFGKTGVWLWGVANGLERIEVRQRPMRSLSAEHTFERDVSDKKEVLQKLLDLADRLHKRVLSAGVDFRVVGIKIRFTHFQTFSRENTLPFPTNSKNAIIQEATNLFREFEENPRKVRLIGLSVAGFRDSTAPSGEVTARLEDWAS